MGVDGTGWRILHKFAILTYLLLCSVWLFWWPNVMVLFWLEVNCKFIVRRERKLKPGESWLNCFGEILQLRPTGNVAAFTLLGIFLTAWLLWDQKFHCSIVRTVISGLVKFLSGNPWALWQTGDFVGLWSCDSTLADAQVAFCLVYEGNLGVSDVQRVSWIWHRTC